jgi:hypothetical protein
MEVAKGMFFMSNQAVIVESILDFKRIQVLTSWFAVIATLMQAGFIMSSRLESLSHAARIFV